MSGVLLNKPMRFFFLVSGAIIWIGILLTGVRIVHWILFVPALFFPFAAITGICPGILVSKKLFGGKEEKKQDGEAES